MANYEGNTLSVFTQNTKWLLKTIDNKLIMVYNNHIRDWGVI